MDAGGADCASVPCGLPASMGPECDGFLGASVVCGRCSLRAVSFGCGCRLLGSFGGVFSDGMTGVASGNSSRPLGSFSDSTHRKKVSFSSSIAAHPARPKLADTTIEMSAPGYWRV